MGHLRKIGPSASGSMYLCMKKSMIIIGRDEQQSDLVLKCNDLRNYISRIHARIVKSSNKYKIFDDSLNGIFINNIKILNEAILNDGDLITFGHPFGEKINSGERIRQPNSDFQYVWEACYCEHSKETKSESIESQVLLPSSNTLDVLTEKITTNFETNQAVDCDLMLKENHISEKYILNKESLKMNSFNDNESNPENTYTNNSKEQISNCENHISCNIKINYETFKSDALINEEPSESTNSIIKSASNYVDNSNINSCIEKFNDKAYIQFNDRDNIIDFILKSMLEKVVLNNQDIEDKSYNITEESKQDQDLVLFREKNVSHKRKIDKDEDRKIKKLKIDNLEFFTNSSNILDYNLSSTAIKKLNSRIFNDRKIDNDFNFIESVNSNEDFNGDILPNYHSCNYNLYRIKNNILCEKLVNIKSINNHNMNNSDTDLMMHQNYYKQFNELNKNILDHSETNKGNIDENIIKKYSADEKKMDTYLINNDCLLNPFRGKTLSTDFISNIVNSNLFTFIDNITFINNEELIGTKDNIEKLVENDLNINNELPNDNKIQNNVIINNTNTDHSYIDYNDNDEFNISKNMKDDIITLYNDNAIDYFNKDISRENYDKNDIVKNDGEIVINMLIANKDNINDDINLELSNNYLSNRKNNFDKSISENIHDSIDLNMQNNIDISLDNTTINYFQNDEDYNEKVKVIDKITLIKNIELTKNNIITKYSSDNEYMNIDDSITDYIKNDEETIKIDNINIVNNKINSIDTKIDNHFMKNYSNIETDTNSSRTNSPDNLDNVDDIGNNLQEPSNKIITITCLNNSESNCYISIVDNLEMKNDLNAKQYSASEVYPCVSKKMSAVDLLSESKITLNNSVVCTEEEQLLIKNDNKTNLLNIQIEEIDETYIHSQSSPQWSLNSEIINQMMENSKSDILNIGNNLNTSIDNVPTKYLQNQLLITNDHQIKKLEEKVISFNDNKFNDNESFNHNIKSIQTSNENVNKKSTYYGQTNISKINTILNNTNTIVSTEIFDGKMTHDKSNKEAIETINYTNFISANIHNDSPKIFELKNDFQQLASPISSILNNEKNNIATTNMKNLSNNDIISLESSHTMIENTLDLNTKVLTPIMNKDVSLSPTDIFFVPLNINKDKTPRSKKSLIETRIKLFKEF